MAMLLYKAVVEGGVVSMFNLFESVILYAL